MRTLLKLIAGLGIVAILTGGYLTSQLTSPYKGFSEPVFLEVKRGMTTAEMASELARSGVVSAPWLFVVARALNRSARLQAGEYHFTTAASPTDVLHRIQKGDIYFTELLLQEGLNIFDMATAVEKQSGIRAADFLAAAKNPSLIQDLDPTATSLEGYLFPSKYRIYRHTTAAQLTKQMTGEFRTQWAKMGNGANPHKTITLASLVEREAQRHEEQPQVSSVFHNRLRQGMKLDCDPTTVYAALLENRYRGTIHQSDLASENPYNTYKHAGLPPGPIANPGVGAIRAALAPAETPYLYFVAKADGSGGHNFSESLKQHVEAVGQYHRATKR